LDTKNNIDIDKLAKISRINLSESEAALAKGQLAGLLKLMESLRTITKITQI
jgi:aspartyl-tRNA(Asn)/glutamyl-tRNA(Gln) amidotransferase subunit C